MVLRQPVALERPAAQAAGDGGIVTLHRALRCATGALFYRVAEPGTGESVRIHRRDAGDYRFVATALKTGSRKARRVRLPGIPLPISRGPASPRGTPCGAWRCRSPAPPR